jgi:hypothetical protein
MKNTESPAYIGWVKVPRKASLELQLKLYLQRWELVKDHILQDGEYGVQMVGHRPYYFVTNYGRVFSLYRNVANEMNQHTGQSVGAKRNTSDLEQLRVRLCVISRETGKIVKRNYRTGRLVCEYCNVSVFNPAGKQVNELDCHHVYRNDMEKGKANNREENLQLVDGGIHRSIYKMIQNGEWTENGVKLKNPKQFYDKMSAIETDDSFAVMACEDKNKPGDIGVWGMEIAPEQEEQLLQNPMVQQVLSAIAAGQKLYDAVALMDKVSKDYGKYEGKVKIVNGLPVLEEGEEISME